MVTLIADNYFGYCKKEVKTQISFAANLYGLCEEEHAGGALVFPAYDLGEEFSGDVHVKHLGHSFGDVCSRFADALELRPEGYAVDRKYPDILYVPEDARFDLHEQKVTWPGGESGRSIKLLPGKTYLRPSGYKVRMERPSEVRSWRLVGTVAEGLPLPQTLHRLRRRQIRNLQAHHRCDPHRAGVRRGPEAGPRPGVRPH